MADVFISYPRADRARVELIKLEIEKLGLSVFFDVQNLEAGDEFPDEIDRAVKQASAVIGCWTPQALKRSWVKKECRVGDRRRTLIPIAIEELAPDDVPVEFEGVHIIDLCGFSNPSQHPAWPEVVRALRQKIDRMTSADDQAPARLHSSGGARSASYKEALTALIQSSLSSETLGLLRLTTDEWERIERNVSATLEQISKNYPLDAVPNTFRDPVAKARFVEAQALLVVELCRIAQLRKDAPEERAEPEQRKLWDRGRKKSQAPIYPNAFGRYTYEYSMYDANWFFGMWRDGRPHGFGSHFVGEGGYNSRSSTQSFGLFDGVHELRGAHLVHELPCGTRSWRELSDRTVTARFGWLHRLPTSDGTRIETADWGVVTEERLDLTRSRQTQDEVCQRYRYEGLLRYFTPNGPGVLWRPDEQTPVVGDWMSGGLPTGERFEHTL